MDVADKIRSGARWLGAAKIITQVYTWVLTVMVMRLLVPEDYALMAMAGVFLSFIVQFEELGLRVKLVQMPDYTPDYARRVFGLVLLTNLALVTLLALASPLIADFFSQPRLIPIILTLSLSLAINALGSIPDAVIKRQLDFRSLAIVDVVRAVVASSTTLALAYFGFGPWALVWGAVIGNVVGAVGLFIASPFRALPSFDFRGMRDTLNFGGLVMLQRLLWWGYSSLDSLLIGRFYPAHALGIYGTAGVLATLPMEKAGQILNVLSFTGLSRVNQDLEKFRHYLGRGVKLVSLILFPTFFGIATIAIEFAPVVLGPQWVELGPIAALLALSAPARCVNAVTNESLNSLGKPALYLRCLIVTTASLAVGLSLSLPFGLQAIAVSVVVSQLIATIYNVRLVCRQIELPPMRLLLAVLPATLAGLTMFLLVGLLRPLLPVAFPSLLGLFATIPLGALIYFGLIAAFDQEGIRLLLGVVWKRSGARTDNV